MNCGVPRDGDSPTGAELRPPRGNTSGRDIRRALNAERAREVLELRRKGLALHAIARQLGISVSTASRRIDRAIALIPGEAVEHVRQLEMMRLDWLTARLNDLVEAGDLAAIKTYLDVMSRRAKMCGLDAPTRQEVTGRDGGPLQIDMSALSVDELERIANGGSTDPVPSASGEGGA